MHSIVFILYLLICIFFIVNSIISIFNIEKYFNIKKPPSILNFLYSTKIVEKNV